MIFHFYCTNAIYIYYSIKDAIQISTFWDIFIRIFVWLLDQETQLFIRGIKIDIRTRTSAIWSWHKRKISAFIKHPIVFHFLRIMIIALPQITKFSKMT